MLTIRPHPLWSIPRRNALVTRKAPFRSVSRTRSQSSSLRNAKRESLMIPALFTRTSAPPNSLSTRSASALTSSRTVTSARTATAWPPRARISAAVASARSIFSRHVRTTRWPPAARSEEMARPMPREPPVTTAVFMARRSSRAQYTRDAPDFLERPRPADGDRSVDPPRHSAEHLAGADLEQRAVARGDHRLEGRVPDSGMDELGREKAPNVLGAPGNGPVRTVERHVGITHALEPRDQRSNGPRHRLHERAVDRPPHSQGQDRERARGESVEGRRNGLRSTGQHELRAAVDVADPDRKAPRPKLPAGLLDHFSAAAHHGGHGAPDAQRLG